MAEVLAVSRLRRVLTLLGMTLAVLLGAALLAVGAGAVWLDGESGRRWLAQSVEAAVAGPDARLTLGAIEGSLPFDLALKRVTMADGQGVWLTVDALRVTLSPSALLTRRVRIERLEADSVEVARAPQTTASPPPAAAPGPGVGFALPDLPVSVGLDRLAVNRLRLGPALLGEAAMLRVDGALALDAGGAGLDGRLSVERIDDQPGKLDASVVFVPASQRLELAVNGAEPAGGVIARALSLPGLPPLSLALNGRGTLDDWAGALTTQVGVAKPLTAEASVKATADGRALSVTAEAAPEGLLDPALARLVGARSSLTAAILLKPDGGVTLRPLTLETAAGRVSLDGTLAADRQSLSLRWSVTAGPDSALHALLPAAAWRDARADGVVEGRLNDLALTLSATATEVMGGDPALARVVGPALTLTGKAQLDSASGRLTLEALTGQAAAATLSAQGALDGWGRSGGLTLTATAADLDRFSALAGRPLGGALSLFLPVRREEDGRLSATLSGRINRLSTGTPVDALLGAAATVKAALALAPDGGMRLDTVELAGGNGRLTGTGALVAGQLDATARLDGTALGPLGAALGTPLDGVLSAEVTARGPLDRLAVTARAQVGGLVADGRGLGATSLEATAAGLPDRPAGRVTLRSQPEGAPLALDAAYALDGDTLRLADLSLVTGANRITGAAQLAMTSGVATGRLEGSLPDLKALSALVGAPLDGAAGFTLALDGKGGRQAATLTANATTLRVNGAAGAPLTVRRVSVAADVADALGKPSGKASLELSGAASGDNAITSLTASLDGALAKATFRAAATGTGGGGPIGLDLAGSLGQDVGVTRVRLERLEGRFAGETLRLTGPATITVADQRYDVAGLRALVGGARLSVDGGMAGDRLKGDIRLDQLPLALARLADPSLTLDGVASLQASVSGTLASPRADATLRLAGLRAKQATEAGIPGVDATVMAQWRNNRLSVNGEAATPNKAGKLSLRAALPLVMNPDSHAVSLPPKGALDAVVEGTLDAALVNDLLASTGDRARGSVKLDVRASGTVAAPKLGGSVTLSGGRFENRASGAVLSGVEARLVGDGEVFTIQSLRARTSNGGTIGGQGVVRPAAAGDRQLDLAITADNARLVDNDLLTADVDAKLTVTGGFLNARLAGPIRLRGADVRIPNRLPVNVVDLKVEEVGTRRNGPTRKPIPPRKAADKPPPPFALALDLTVDAPNRIFVRGRGLDTELGGQLRIGGRADAPEVTGRLSILKGRLDILSHSFAFNRGNLDFDGTQPIDPRLDLLAEVTANGVTAQIEVSGTAGQPKIALTSPQGLPQDEILSAVLFGKSVGSLGAGEAVQLAQSAAALTGVGGEGGGLLDRVRRSTGLDRLDFSQSSDGKGGAVQAGRYLDDGVYVGVEQGMGANQTRAKVEVEIYKGLKGKADVGADSETRFGLSYEKDY